MLVFILKEVITPHFTSSSIIMDLTQSKLTLAEWNSIEIIPAEKEVRIMKMIINGYDNLDISVNSTQTLLGFLKMEQSETMDNYLFAKYILPLIILNDASKSKDCGKKKGEKRNKKRCEYECQCRCGYGRVCFSAETSK